MNRRLHTYAGSPPLGGVAGGEPDPYPLSTMAVPLALELIADDDAWPDDLGDDFSSQLAAAVVAHWPIEETASASILLSSDARVRELNAAYRGFDKPTNVLSFPSPAEAPRHDQRFLGDVILAHETVACEAAALGIPLNTHVSHLIVHGILHLFGLDHETDAEAEVMEALEIRMLAELGIANPYLNEEQEDLGAGSATNPSMPR